MESALSIVDVLFCSPEYAMSKQFTDILKNQAFRDRVAPLCFDEAHCITEWGTAQFRPDYGNIHEIVSMLCPVPVLVMSATMTEPMLHDTITLLNIKKHVLVSQNPDRNEIFLERGDPGPAVLNGFAQKFC